MIRIRRMDEGGNSRVIVVVDEVQKISIITYCGKKPCAQIVSVGLFGPETMRELGVAFELAARLSTGELEICWKHGYND